jgi:hypothetical protein
MSICSSSVAYRRLRDFFFLDLPATLSAMATACFCGFPSWTMVRMFVLIALRELPFFNGMGHLAM